MSHNSFGSHNSLESHTSLESQNNSGASSTRLTPLEPAALTAELRDGMFAVDTAPDEPPEGEAWSSWDGAQHGPNPRPDWVITDLGVLMAAKRFRDSDHRMFHRDAGYLEGRRVRRSREMRAMARRTEFGKQMISSQWAFAEFNALGQLWAAGLPVPYPVQMTGTEVLMEFIGDGDQAAPRLAQARPEPALLVDLFEQFRVTTSELALRGWAHGDLSPYNALLHNDRLVIIDWPQIVDIIGNPRGPEFLQRDCHNMCAWFVSRGLAVDEDELFGDFMAAATSRW